MIDQRLVSTCETLGLVKLSPCVFCDGKGVTNSLTVECPLCRGSGRMMPCSPSDLLARLEHWASKDPARLAEWDLELRRHCEREFGLIASRDYPSARALMLPLPSRIEAVLRVAEKEAS